MYINKIDDLIGDVIDDFFVKIILKNSVLPKIYKEQNFVKFQKEINDIMIEYANGINYAELRDLVKSNEAVNSVSEAIKRYIAFYIFLTIGFNYTSKDDTYINNIVEFTKNQSSYNYKINNFFNSDSNAILIKYNTMVKQILTILDADQSKIDIIKKKPEYKETIVFLNSLGGEYINKNLKLSSLDNNKQTQSHNIIKTIIVVFLYKEFEKKEFFRLLEMSENLEGESIFIDIVVPKQNYIDFSTVEQTIGSTGAMKILSYNLWNFFMEHSELIMKPPLSIDEKISLLIDSGIVHPICDDFLLYHKESERYDRVEDPAQTKKKEDTKIRYIVNKIETVSDYYADQTKANEKIKENIKKKFYIPLSDRKAITVNHNEDISIINKFSNQSNRSIENNDHFNDLIMYKSYPFINFKDFEKTGISVPMTKTVDVVRQVSIVQSGEFKQNKNNVLQMRVGSKDSILNVVGFIIPTSNQPMQCIKTKNVTDIRSISKKKNGYSLINKYLRETELGTKQHNSSVYWLFDQDVDFAQVDEDFNQIGKSLSSDKMKHIVGALYDSIIENLYYIIVSKLEKTKELNLQLANNIVNMYKSKLIDIPNESNIINKLTSKVYELIEKVEPGYDINEDFVHGITGNIIELPKYNNDDRNRVPMIKVNLSDISEYGILNDREVVDGICQHNITWDRIASIQKSNPQLYSNQLYEFIQQYVWENVDQEFVCKSCGFQLNIKKYITDGAFDDETQKFVTYSMPMDVPLEEIQEYEKLIPTIRNLDKLIERIASISNVQHLTKSSFNVKWQRKGIVKNAIDLILVNNENLHKVKNKPDSVLETYGINKNFTTLFVFKLENSIFLVSSKDKDKYKSIKQNNILIYLTFLLLLEINETHVPFIGGDKKGACNFYSFDKVMSVLFGGFKIRINSKGELSNITNYKILCYMIYIISCSIIKYNMWDYEYPEGAKKSKYAITIQKIFVNTLIDLMNGILEFSSKPGANRLYEILSVKMFRKLNSTFSSEELYNRLSNDGKSSMAGEKKGFIMTKNNFIPLSGKVPVMEYDVPFRITCRAQRFYMKKKYASISKFGNINNMTNCESGEFHNWKSQNGNYVCKKCNVSMDGIELNENETKKITVKAKFVRMSLLAEQFCTVDGLLHQFINENNKSVCIKCHNENTHVYKHDELEKLENALEKAKAMKSEKETIELNTTNEIINKEMSYVEKVVKSATDEYNKFKEGNKNMKFIDEFLDEIQKVIGDDFIQSGESNLVENSYIINHDKFGTALAKNIVITEKNNKITYKQNHPDFDGNDVIYYTSMENGKTDIFYDASTKILLGYKEINKKIVLNTKQDKRLIVNYSIANKLKILGYSSKFIHLDNEYKKKFDGREDIPNVNKEEIVKSLIMNIIRMRIHNLKKVITEFQTILYRILNNYPLAQVSAENESEYFSNKFNILIEKYKKKMDKLKLSNSKGEHTVFKHWKGISRGIFAKNITDINYDFEKYATVSADDINKLDAEGNIILCFIITEFTKLLKHNQNDAFTRTGVAQFIVEYINAIFDLFNTERIANNIEIKKFDYILSSASYMREVGEKSGIANTEGIYSEFTDPDQEMSDEQKDEMYDNMEERDAMDVDSDFENDEVFENAQEWEPAN